MKNSIMVFTAEWCVPCKNFKKQLSKLEDILDYTLYDIDDDKELFNLYEIKAVPTIVVINDDGKEIARMVGAEKFSALKKEYLE